MHSTLLKSVWFFLLPLGDSSPYVLGKLLFSFILNCNNLDLCLFAIYAYLMIQSLNSETSFLFGDGNL